MLNNAEFVRMNNPSNTAFSPSNGRNASLYEHEFSSMLAANVDYHYNDILIKIVLNLQSHK
jgi:hypothetical protein